MSSLTAAIVLSATILGLFGCLLTVAGHPKRLGVSESDNLTASLFELDVPRHPWWWDDVALRSVKRGLAPESRSDRVLLGLMTATGVGVIATSRSLPLAAAVLAFAGSLAVFAAVADARQRRLEDFLGHVRQELTAFVQAHRAEAKPSSSDQGTGATLRVLHRLPDASIASSYRRVIVAFGLLVVVGAAIGEARGATATAVPLLVLITYRAIDEAFNRRR